MGTVNHRVASKDAFVILQQTIESKVLEDLKSPLERIVHKAIREAVVEASRAPSELAANNETSTPAASAGEVSRPASGGACAKVWDALDSITKDKSGTIPTLQEVQKLARRKRWNANTARVQYYRWRSAQPQPQAAPAVTQ
jgi:hypothetical protein